VDGFGNLGYLLGYVGLLGVISVGATGVFRYQSLQLNKTNRRLVEANTRESTLSARMADQLQELSIFGTVVDNSVVGIAVADMRQPDNPLVYVNQAFTAITGYSRELTIGFNCRFLQGPDTDPKELERLRQAIRSGSPYSGELINYRLDGSRFWNRLTLTPVGGSSREQPDFYVANQVDITSIKDQAGVPLRELRALEGELQTAEQALSDAARFGDALQRQMEAAGDLASLQMEAFLRSQQQALRQLTEVFERIAQLLRLHRDAG
jgi:PAS domain S-box-containing protein